MSMNTPRRDTSDFYFPVPHPPIVWMNPFTSAVNPDCNEYGSGISDCLYRGERKQRVAPKKIARQAKKNTKTYQHDVQLAMSGL